MYRFDFDLSVEPEDDDSPDDQVEGVALHEAGHAVACLVLGRRFEYVTVFGMGDTQGHLQFDGAPRSRRAALVDAVVTFAGEAASELPSGYDSEFLQDLVLDWAPRDTEAFLGEARERAEDLVERYAEVIEDVAQALLDQVTLTWDDLAPWRVFLRRSATRRVPGTQRRRVPSR